MYTFRYNPLFQHWVLLGDAVPHTLPLGKLQLRQPHHLAPQFTSAHYPASPFVLESGEQPAHLRALKGEMLFDEQSPVGEYELLLYLGELQWKQWGSEEWQQWLALFSDRLRQLHLNAHVSYAGCTLHTRAVHSLEGKQPVLRVGDLVAASHPIVGLSSPIEKELIERLVEKDKLYVIAADTAGVLYAPSAPKERREVWLLPTAISELENLSTADRKGLAQLLSHLFEALFEEFPSSEWVLQLHLPVLGASGPDSWWIQVYEDTAQPSVPLKVVPLPERFVITLKHLIASQKARKK